MNTQVPVQSSLLTVNEVAKLLRVDATTVRRWIKAGVLNATTLPGKGGKQHFRIKQEAIDTLLASPIID